jgi:flagellar hook assembly protein FlgD
MKPLLLLLSLLPASVLPLQAQKPLSFAYRLKADARTSAGVFDTAGALIRTLWSNRSESAGAHSAAWDGTDDLGASIGVASTKYQIRVLTSNVTYTWDGVVGTTEGCWDKCTNGWHGVSYQA